LNLLNPLSNDTSSLHSIWTQFHSKLRRGEIFSPREITEHYLLMLHASVNGKNGTEAIAKGRKKKNQSNGQKKKEWKDVDDIWYSDFQ
jgi:hypothetical protein